MLHLVLGCPSPVAMRVMEDAQSRAQSVATIATRHVAEGLPAGVEWIEGDATRIDFGLSGPEYQRLVERTSLVTLADISVRAVRDVEESPLVRQAAEVAEFAAAGGATEGVRFLSSLLVFGNKTGAVSESDFLVGQRFEHRQEEALAVAEKLIHRVSAIRPVAVVRAAPIVGSERGGELLEHTALSRLARQIEASKEDLMFEFSDRPIWFETVERAAQALALAPAVVGGRVYHLVDEEPLTDRILLQFLASRASRSIMESPKGTLGWANFFRAGPYDQKALFGWDLHFGRKNAQEHLASILDRNGIAVLEAFFGPATDMVQN